MGEASRRRPSLRLPGRSPAVHCLRSVYDAGFVETLAREERWVELEGYLTQYHLTRFGRTAGVHPQILLHCYRARLIQLLRSGLGREASRFFHDNIAPLRHPLSEEYIRLQIDTIWESLTRDERFTKLVESHPPNVANIINEYIMRLPFPAARNDVLTSGGTAAPPGVQGMGMARVQVPPLTGTRANERQIHEGTTSSVSSGPHDPSDIPRSGIHPAASIGASSSFQTISVVSPAGQDGVQGFSVYNAGFVERMAQQERWLELQEYLTQYFVRRFGNDEREHPQLLLYCRRGFLIWLLRAGLHSDAIRFYHGYIGALRHPHSGPYIRSQVDIIWKSITQDKRFTELVKSHPPNVADLINDYMRRHFPEAIGHTNPPGTSSPMWQFAVSLGREGKKQKLRCIFCQQVMTTNRVGEQMKNHLKKCPKMTSKWRQKVRAVCFQIPSNKRQRVTGEQIDYSQGVLVLDTDMLIRQVAHGAIATLERLGFNDQVISYIKDLRGNFVSLASGTFPTEEMVMLISRLVRDMMAAHIAEPQSLASKEVVAALQELHIICYQLEFLVPLTRNPLPSYEAVQYVPNEAQQQFLAEPLAQQQQSPPVQNDDPLVSDTQQPVAATPPVQQEHPRFQSDEDCQQLVPAPSAQQQQPPAPSAQQQQLRIQNEENLVPGSQHELEQFDPTAGSDDVQRWMALDPTRYDAFFTQCCQDLPDFLDSASAGPSDG